MSQIYNTVDIDCFIILIVCWFCWYLSVWIVRCILNWTCKQTYPACRSRFFPRQYYFKCAWILILKAVFPSILELCLIYRDQKGYNFFVEIRADQQVNIVKMNSCGVCELFFPLRRDSISVFILLRSSNSAPASAEWNSAFFLRNCQVPFLEGNKTQKLLDARKSAYSCGSIWPVVGLAQLAHCQLAILFYLSFVIGC